MRFDSPGVDSSSPDEDLVSVDHMPGCATLLTPH